MQLTILTYLSPSIPAGFFRAVADEIRTSTGVPTHLIFESRFSGPLEGDDEPFSSGLADIGFLCAPSFRYLRSRGVIQLLPVAVPTDPRSAGQAVYFSEIIVPVASSAMVTTDLASAEWACNDSHSLSGFFSIRERFSTIAGAEPRYRFSGSHLDSIDLVAAGSAEAAAIDSNVLRYELARRPELLERIRIIDSWGPRPMQPTVTRASLERSLRDAVAEALVGIQSQAIAEFGFCGFATVDESTYMNAPSFTSR
jgi:ABC-type phosphate/phosphonate transport system substrate-binding protein